MGLTHFDESGKAVMVDVSQKSDTLREACAEGKILVNREVFQAVQEGTVGKGDVLGVAATAGIMAAKRTWELIPMCHILPITNCMINFDMDEKECSISCICTVKVTGKTGVEMEALTGASVALLTIYDMCKALDKTMEITEICLVRKTGGKSGDFIPERGMGTGSGPFLKRTESENWRKKHGKRNESPGMEGGCCDAER